MEGDGMYVSSEISQEQGADSRFWHHHKCTLLAKPLEKCRNGAKLCFPFFFHVGVLALQQ